MNVEELEKAAEKIFKRGNYFNDYVLEKIAKRINKFGRLNTADQQAIKNMANIKGDIKDITKKLAVLTQKNIGEVEKIYTKVVSDGVNSYKPLYDVKNMDFVPFAENDFAQAIVAHWYKQTAAQMINLSRTKAIGFIDSSGEFTSLQGKYQKIIDEAVTALTTGTTDFNTAMRQTIIEIGGSGIVVDYGEGITRSLDSVIRANVLYGAKQAAQAYDEHITKELDLNGWEIDAHPGCRPSHMIMQGGIYAAGDEPITVNGKEYKGIDEDIGTAALDGSGSVQGLLNDYGCLHFKTGFEIGVSEPRYSKEQLKKIKDESTKLIEYDGKEKTLYEWKQKRREIEREVRKQKITANMAKAAGNKQLVKDCNIRIKALKAKYNDLTESVGLQKTEERMRVTKSLTNSAESSKIKEKIQDKKITKITDSTIDKIPNVQSVIYSKDETNRINSQHKKLLKLSMQNGNSEVAFLLNNKLEKIGEFIGNETEVDLGNSVYGKGKNLFVMHNHPRNSGFSLSDIQTFLSVDNIKTISIVKNNGGVELITKGKTYSKKDSYIELKRNIKKYVKDQTDDLQYSKAIEKFLAKTQNERNGIEWLKI